MIEPIVASIFISSIFIVAKKLGEPRNYLFLIGIFIFCLASLTCWLLIFDVFFFSTIISIYTFLSFAAWFFILRHWGRNIGYVPLCILIYFLLYSQGELSQWDDFNHWGLVLRDLSLFDKISFEAFASEYSNYPIFPSILVLLISLGPEISIGGGGEGLAIGVSYGLFIFFAFTFCQIAEIKPSRFGVLVFCLLFLGSGAAVHSYKTLMVDGLILALTANLVLIIVRGFSSVDLIGRQLLVFGVVTACFLAMLKPAGLVISLLCLVLVPLVGGVSSWRLQCSVLKSRDWFFVFCVVASSVFLLVWQRETLVGLNLTGQHESFVWPDYWLSVLFHSLQKSFLPFLDGHGNTLGAMNLSICAVCLYLAAARPCRKLACCFVTILLVCWVILVGLNYGLNFSKGEAEVLHSIDRYVGSVSYAAGLVALAFLLDARGDLSQSIAGRRPLISVLALVMLAFADLKAFGVFKGDVFHNDRRRWVGAMESFVAEFSDASMNRIVFIEDGCDSGQIKQMLTYDFPELSFRRLKLCERLGDVSMQAVDFYEALEGVEPPVLLVIDKTKTNIEMNGDVLGVPVNLDNLVVYQNNNFLGVWLSQ